MKRFIFAIMTAAVMTATMTGCKSDDVTEAKPAKEILMVLGGDVIQFRANEEGPAQDVNIQADCRWTVEVDAGNFGDNFSVSPRQGNGNGSLVITSNQNTDPNLTREATITLVSDGGLRQRVTVRQTGGDEALNISKNSFSFAATTTEAQLLNITSNTAWTITMPAGVNWLHIDKNSGTGGSTDIMITVDNAVNDVTRNATLSINYSGKSAQVDVTQEGISNVTLTASVDHLDFGAAGDRATIRIQSNAEWHAYIPSTVDWLTFEEQRDSTGVIRSNSGVGDGQINVRCTENNTVLARMTAVIIVAGTKDPKQAVILVEQRGNESAQPLQTSAGIGLLNVTRQTARLLINIASEEVVGDFGLLWAAEGGQQQRVVLGRGITSQSITHELTGLTEGTTYVVQAFVVKPSTGETIYSEPLTFATLSSVVTVGELTSLYVSNTSAEFRYSFAADEAAVSYGLVYSRDNQQPTTADQVVEAGSGRTGGSVLAVLNNLEERTTYYVRAYVQSQHGIEYSPNVVAITTSATIHEPGESDNPDPQLARALR